MTSLAKQIVNILLNRYPMHIVKPEFESPGFTRFNNRPIEFGFVIRTLAETCSRVVLDVGAGTTALPRMMRDCGCLVTATDTVFDYWPAGMHNPRPHVVDDTNAATRQAGSYDLVTCVSVLEHIPNSDDAIRNMFGLLKQGGFLLLTFPYHEKKYVRNVYELPGSSDGREMPYITQSFSRNELDRWVKANDGSIVEQEYWKCREGDHWTIGGQVIPPKRVAVEDTHQLSCVLIRKDRVGAGVAADPGPRSRAH